MSAKEVIGTAAAVFVGTLLALAVAGLHVKSQLSSAASGNSTLGSILSLLTPRSGS